MIWCFVSTFQIIMTYQWLQIGHCQSQALVKTSCHTWKSLQHNFFSLSHGSAVCTEHCNIIINGHYFIKCDIMNSSMTSHEWEMSNWDFSCNKIAELKCTQWALYSSHDNIGMYLESILSAKCRESPNSWKSDWHWPSYESEHKVSTKSMLFIALTLWASGLLFLIDLFWKKSHNNNIGLTWHFGMPSYLGLSMNPVGLTTKLLGCQNAMSVHISHVIVTWSINPHARI